MGIRRAIPGSSRRSLASNCGASFFRTTGDGGTKALGGGFGLRNNLYPEQAAILWAAKRVGQPVKWTNDRSESFLTDYQGRDMQTTARLALTRDGCIIAYHVDHIGGVGGQTVTYVPLSNAYRAISALQPA